MDQQDTTQTCVCVCVCACVRACACVCCLTCFRSQRCVCEHVTLTEPALVQNLELYSSAICMLYYKIAKCVRDTRPLKLKLRLEISLIDD